ncbi:hypothetical protein BU17DRAFT_48053 [Hysterangium stoloniferum]|nr:hypothetical protein BU17DRAFT_48053 [Hysterangium stoloniferum]
MANDSNMSPISWKALRSSRLTAIKDYVAKKDYRGTYETLSSGVRGATEEGAICSWDQWAQHRFGKSQRSFTDVQHTILGVERLQLFPGWAVRRFAERSKFQDEHTEFSLEVYVSGFASSLRPPDKASRSQKAFYRLAKGYASLPKLSPGSSQAHETHAPSWYETLHGSDIPADIDLSKLPPPPCDLEHEAELEDFVAKFGALNAAISISSDDERGTNDQHSSCGFAGSTDMSHSSSPSSASNRSTPISNITESTTLFPQQVSDLIARKMHANLDARLQPFWSSAISNRLVRLRIFCPNSGQVPEDAHDMLEGQDTDFTPLITKNVYTNAQGSFQTTITVPWEKMATHPPSLHIVFGKRDIEYPVVIQAEMWPAPSPTSPSSSKLPTPPASTAVPVKGSSHIVTRVTVPLPVPYVPLRLISDIDDTIKYAGVLHGAKKVFQNVFTRHLEDLVIADMVEWYKQMWLYGVRFHYVSNSPYQLLPVLNEFFRISTLPEGSIRLKSYAARSFLPTILSSPAARKRQGVVEVLDAFPESHFILVGDTGEQDLELYTELARERPNQIVGVFLRDVTSTPGSLPVGVGIGYGAASANIPLSQFERELIDLEPQAMNPMPSGDSLYGSTASLSKSYNPSMGSNSPTMQMRSSATHASTPSTLPGTPPKLKTQAGLTPEERRRQELEIRIECARAEISSHIAFRVFRTPEECVEIQDIVRKYPKKVA